MLYGIADHDMRTPSRCPFEAIAIINLPTNLESQVTHRYTANAFKLHRLPTPRPGQVLGLVGTNGIGKSTALKILAGKLKPNLGRYDVSLRSYIDKMTLNIVFIPGSTRLARNFEILSWIRVTKLLHEGARGQSKSVDQTAIRGSHPPSDQNPDDGITDA
jgi:ABC-type hemin transport system ATPase subunit